MATKEPRKYNTGADSALGKLLRSLMRSTREPVDPSMGGAIPTPPLPDVNVNGIDPAALQRDFSTYGAGSNLYAQLAKADPGLAKSYSDAFAKQAAYNSDLNRFNNVSGAHAAIGNGSATLGQIGTTVGDYWRSQPMLGKAAGIGLGLGNLGGLVDNDKFGGQLGGLALGGLGAKAIGFQNPGTAALLTLGGGELGALFDKLRSKREKQRGQIQQSQQMRR